MLKKNKNLVKDCDDERKTALHIACHNDSLMMAQVLIDFGAAANAKDDFLRRPIDELHTAQQRKGGQLNAKIVDLLDRAAAGTLVRDLSKYKEPLYVKYLTPIEQI